MKSACMEGNVFIKQLWEMVARVVVLFFFLPTCSMAQGSLTICNDFESELEKIYLDSTSNWEIGQPTTMFLNGSFESTNSIVTDLDSLYNNSDSSLFYAVLAGEDELPNNLGSWAPLEIEMTHRYDLDSVGDHGMIEISLDDGATWHDVLSGEYAPSGILYQNSHVFEVNGDTLVDSLVVQGNSGGWVFSRMYMELDQILSEYGPEFPDSVIMRVSLISDSSITLEGWQIDNLCLEMDYPTDVLETSADPTLKLFPNPSTGTFTVANLLKARGELQIFDMSGLLVFSKNYNQRNEIKLSLGLYTGLYIVQFRASQTVHRTVLSIVH